MDSKKININKYEAIISHFIRHEENAKNYLAFLNLIIKNPYSSYINQILKLQKENHNLFGEKGARLKIKKRGKMGIKAHFRKEDPSFSLKNYCKNELNSYINFFDDFLEFNQNNVKERFSRLLHIYRIDFHYSYYPPIKRKFSKFSLTEVKRAKDFYNESNLYMETDKDRKYLTASIFNRISVEEKEKEAVIREKQKNFIRIVFKKYKDLINNNKGIKRKFNKILFKKF